MVLGALPFSPIRMVTRTARLQHYGAPFRARKAGPAHMRLHQRSPVPIWLDRQTSSGTRLNGQRPVRGSPFTRPEPTSLSRPSGLLAGTPAYGFSLATFPPGSRYQGQERLLAHRVRGRSVWVWIRRTLQVWLARKQLTRKEWKYRVRPTSPLSWAFCAGRPWREKEEGEMHARVRSRWYMWLVTEQCLG